MWLKSMCVKFNIKVFAMMDRWLAGWLNTIDYINPYVVRLDHKPEKSQVRFNTKLQVF